MSKNIVIADDVYRGVDDHFERIDDVTADWSEF